VATWWFNPDREAYEEVEVLEEKDTSLTLLRATGQEVEEERENLLFTNDYQDLTQYPKDS
jgi:hypothetical protein